MEWCSEDQSIGGYQPVSLIQPAIIAIASSHAQANSHLPFLLYMSILKSNYTSELSVFIPV
jgi:hypothetical protein